MERDKFLTEAMGVCFWQGHACDKCSSPHYKRRIAAIDFSTWDNFGDLLRFVESKYHSWGRDFISEYFQQPEGNWPFNYTMKIEPVKFANAVYEFLKGYEQMHEFTLRVKLKGWLMKELGERWEFSPTHMSNIARNPKPRDWDALAGLPDKEKL